MTYSLLFLCCRDGGLKRAKVKDSFKEEQQKNYSKMLVRNGSQGNLPAGTESDWNVVLINKYCATSLSRNSVFLFLINTKTKQQNPFCVCIFSVFGAEPANNSVSLSLFTSSFLWIFVQ